MCVFTGEPTSLLAQRPRAVQVEHLRKLSNSYAQPQFALFVRAAITVPKLTFSHAYKTRKKTYEEDEKQ